VIENGNDGHVILGLFLALTEVWWSLAGTTTLDRECAVISKQTVSLARFVI
jgi:hypothetical protein